MSANIPPAPPPGPTGQPNPYGQQPGYGQPGYRQQQHGQVSPHGRVPAPDGRQAMYGQAPPPSAEEARPSMAGRAPNTGFGRAVLAALIWAALNLVVSLILFPFDSTASAGAVAGAMFGAMLIPLLLAALGTWLIARTRRNGLQFWQLALIALPIFLVIRVLMNAAMLARVAGSG